MTKKSKPSLSDIQENIEHAAEDIPTGSPRATGDKTPNGHESALHADVDGHDNPYYRSDPNESSDNSEHKTPRKDKYSSVSADTIVDMLSEMPLADGLKAVVSALNHYQSQGEAKKNMTQENEQQTEINQDSFKSLETKVDKIIKFLGVSADGESKSNSTNKHETTDQSIEGLRKEVNELFQKYNSEHKSVDSDKTEAEIARIKAEKQKQKAKDAREAADNDDKLSKENEKLAKEKEDEAKESKKNLKNAAKAYDELVKYKSLVNEKGTNFEKSTYSQVIKSIKEMKEQKSLKREPLVLAVNTANEILAEFD